MSKPDAVALRRRAMDLLARREHSRYELSGKLRDRFPEAGPGLIDEVLAALEEENLLSDQRFAEEFLRMRMRRGFGWLHIRADLQSRGLNDALTADLERPEEDWLELAESVACSRLGGQGNLVPGGREHQRIFRFLQSRGFAAGIAHKSLQKFIRSSK